MIADDRKLIIGSANLNDRSMWGSRDSELAVFLNAGRNRGDYEIKKDNRIYSVSKKIHEFRRKIFIEHFGLDSHEIAFPDSNVFWEKAWEIARTNTEIYEQIFNVYPSDNLKNWEDLAKLKDKPKKIDTKAFELVKPRIKGYAVLYPYKFLEEVRLVDVKSSMANPGLLMLPIRALY